MASGEQVTDTSDAAVERLARDLDGEAAHRGTALALGDSGHVEWCDWMARVAATLRALLAERAALREALGEMYSSALSGAFYDDYDEASARLGRARAALAARGDAAGRRVTAYDIGRQAVAAKISGEPAPPGAALLAGEAPSDAG